MTLGVTLIGVNPETCFIEKRFQLRKTMTAMAVWQRAAAPHRASPRGTGPVLDISVGISSIGLHMEPVGSSLDHAIPDLGFSLDPVSSRISYLRAGAERQSRVAIHDGDPAWVAPYAHVADVTRERSTIRVRATAR
jgi:hypothetical protein